MSKPIIVIVDSGVDSSHPQLINEAINEVIYNEFDAKSSQQTFGHGTAIYGIIRSCLDIAEIINIRVVGIENGVDEDVLVSVLHYIDDNIDAKIINLSLGIRIVQNLAALKDVCDKLANKGVVIVSAFDNSGCISYPAALDNVIGVVSSNDCIKINDFSYIDDSIINIAAKGGHQRVLWTTPRYLMMNGNSLACAHVTVQVAKILSKGIHVREHILNELMKSANNRYMCTKKLAEQKIFPICKAVIFPFNKEMHSLLRFNESLSFSIVDVYDIKYSGNIGASTKSLLKDEHVADFTIKNITNIDYESFDTLIIGHLDELSSLINKGALRSNLLNDAIKHGKNIYAFDDINRSDNIDRSEKIFFPRITQDNLPANRFGMLYRASKPILGVFGTSSRQGKFTLQLILRKLLIEKGYKVGQIGTEPSSLLYGMDYVFPMGYNSSVYINDYDTIRYLNHIINKLCVADNDIIIVGSQSGTVTYDTGNIVRYPICQYSFLLGTQPDAVILCINPYDDYNYVYRTISFIESTANCKVISLVIFPMDIKEGWSGIYGIKTSIDEQRIADLKNIYSKMMNIPVFCLGDINDYNKIIAEIENYFSE